MKETILAYAIFLICSLVVANCGIFPAEEVYYTNESVNDNSSAYDESAIIK